MLKVPKAEGQKGFYLFAFCIGISESLARTNQGVYITNFLSPLTISEAQLERGDPAKLRLNTS